MKWEKTGRTVKDNGESTTYYAAEKGKLRIESRKKAIPHAGGRSGYWMHTSYFLIMEDGTEREFWSLKDAKEYAEGVDV